MIYQVRGSLLVAFIILVFLLIVLVHFLLSLPLLALAILALVYYFTSRFFIKIKQYLKKKSPQDFSDSQPSATDTVEVEAEIID